MATTKQQIDKFNKSVAKMMVKVTNKKTMKELGEITLDVVVERTRGKGKGLDANGATLKKLKPVKPEYAKWRKKQQRHPDAARGKQSNLTFKGDLLDELKVKNLKRKVFTLGWSKKKQRDKAKGQEEQGRPFLFLSTKEINLISKKLDEIIAKAVEYGWDVSAPAPELRSG